MEFKEFMPTDYQDLERRDFIELNYPNIIGKIDKFSGWVEDVTPYRLRLSMSKPHKGNEGLLDRLVRPRLYKDFERERITNLKRLEVVLKEDLKEDMEWDTGISS